MLRIAAYIFGMLFIAAGIIGLIPMATPNEMLLGQFHVNMAHNIMHLASGIAALYAGSISICASRRYFQIFGTMYLLVAILGYFYGNAPIFGLISNNMPAVGLHSGIALVSLYLGFYFSSEEVS